MTDSGRTVSGGAISGVTDSGVTNSEKSASGATAPGFLVQFLNDFEPRNPFRRGERNDLALKQGRVSRSKGFSKKELEEVISLFIRRYAATDFTAEDIRQRITAGYQFIDSLPQKTEIPGEGANRVHFPYDPHSPLKIGLKIHEMTCFFTMLLSGFLWHISYKQTDRCFFQSVLTDVPFSRC